MPKILIVEDEMPAREYLKKLIREAYPEIGPITTAEDAETAKKLIAEIQPDIVFLDIELPGKNGFTLLEECQPVNFEVIFTTAFIDYAARAFEYFALGYMVKPLEAGLLKKNLDKAIQRLDGQKMNEKIEMMLRMVQTRDEPKKSLPLPTQHGFELVQTEQIVYCRSEGNYTTFYLKDKRCIMISKQLGVYEKILPAQAFIRIHSQYIINTSYVTKYSKGSGGSVTLTTGEELPVSANRKQDFIERFMH
jgi:two-component system LytT family response regulator